MAATTQAFSPVVLPTLEKELWQSLQSSKQSVFRVLPTLEKELWQSLSCLFALFLRVLPTLEKELWQSAR